MEFIDTFKKRWQRREKDKENIKKDIKEVPDTEEKKEEVKDSKKEEEKVRKAAKTGGSALASRVLISPHITEKSNAAAERDVYTFRVMGHATKPEIKKAVQSLYGAKVNKVRVIKSAHKKRVVRGVRGKKPGFKKALVELKKGEKIEFV